VVFNFLLWPIVRWLARLRIPEFIGAAVVISTVLGALIAIGYELSGPVSDWITRAPQIARKLEEELQYPGQIKVVVIRETRAVDFAR